MVAATWKERAPASELPLRAPASVAADWGRARGGGRLVVLADLHPERVTVGAEDAAGDRDHLVAAQRAPRVPQHRRPRGDLELDRLVALADVGVDRVLGPGRPQA